MTTYVRSARRSLWDRVPEDTLDREPDFEESMECFSWWRPTTPQNELEWLNQRVPVSVRALKEFEDDRWSLDLVIC